MKLHNTYTVRRGGDSVTACNTVSENFKQIFLEHPAWAQFIVLTEEDGTRTEQPCSLQFINADILKGGRLRAVYTAQFEGKRGAVYKSVSIVAVSGGEDVSCAQINFKGTDEEISVKASIFLDCVYDGDILLTGGDNALVRRLLGAGTAGVFSVSAGSSTYPSYPSLRGAALQGTAETVTPTVQGDSIVFGGAGTAGNNRELLLRYDGKSVLRALRSGSYCTQIVTSMVENGSVLIADKYVDMITGVLVDDVSYMGYDEMTVATHALKVNDDTLAVGVGGTVISDPGEEYMAVVTHSYVEVCRPDPLTGGITKLFRVPRNNEKVEICRGGSLVLWSSEELVLYDRDNGEYVERHYAIPCGEYIAVVREGIRYHAATSTANQVFRYALENNTYRLLEKSQLGANERYIVGRCSDYVLYGTTSFVVRSIDVNRTTEFSYKGYTQGVTANFSAGGYFLYFSDALSGYVYDVVRGTTTKIAKGYVANGRLLYKKNAAIYIYDVVNGVRVLSGEYTVRNLTSACIAGGFLFTVTGGILNNYYLSGKNVALRLPVTYNGKRCVVTVRHKEPSGGDTPVRFTMTT